MRRKNIVAALVKGAAAGAIATWLMGRVTTLAYRREDEEARKREDEARQGKTSYEVAAAKLARRVGHARLEPEQQGRYGNAIHWVLGIGTGALYSAVRSRAPIVGLGRGLLFGTAFWLLVDEIATPVLGLSPGPGDFPWQTHARGLAGHLAYGAALTKALDLVESIA